jgi:hypothetical protein
MAPLLLDYSLRTRSGNPLFSRFGWKKNENAVLLCSKLGAETTFAGALPAPHKVQYEKGRAVWLSSQILVSGVLMAGSSRTTFAKRQKERQRQEKQAEKAQRKLQRKAQDQEQDPNAPEKPKDLTVTYNEEGIPEGFGFHDF